MYTWKSSLDENITYISSSLSPLGSLTGGTLPLPPKVFFPGEEETLRAFVLGPVTAGHIRECGVSANILDIVKNLLYDNLLYDNLSNTNNLPTYFLKPTVIRSFIGKEVVVHFPSISQLSKHTYEVSGLSYLCSMISCISESNLSSFIEELESRLILTITGDTDAC